MDKESLIQAFSLLTTGNLGIESFVTKESHESIFQRLGSLGSEPLSKVQFNQLLGLSKEKGVSDGFFAYYWLQYPSTICDITVIPGFALGYDNHNHINSLPQLLWGFHRLYIDGLLFSGNVRAFYRQFASKSYEEIDHFISKVRIDTDAIKRRGPTLPFHSVSKDNRYLISEMACKSYGSTPETESELKVALIQAWQQHRKTSLGSSTIRALIDGEYAKAKFPNQFQLKFSVDDILDQVVESEADIEGKYGQIAKAFITARNAALENTKLYLSLVNDLDVYVATSMRSREDFRKMASLCDQVFQDGKLSDLHLRYFDPTLSAAEGHQDKGLIECLMVKCAKVLVYCAGDKESYGKDAEAAMALSLGKLVIFFCDEEKRESFYRDVHPLSRLINFETGVAVGAMVAAKPADIAELLDRIFENKMQYEIIQPKPAYLQLKEKLTGSVVRLQTNDQLLAEAFWNYYRSQS